MSSFTKSIQLAALFGLSFCAWTLLRGEGEGGATTGGLHVIVGGNGTSTNYPVTTSLTSNGVSHGLFSILTPGSLSTSLDFSTYIPAVQSQVRDTWVDPAGDIYVSGVTATISMANSAGSFQPAFAGGPDDAFICKYSPAHIRLWCSLLGTNGPQTEEEIYSIGGADPAGNIAICGSLNGPVSSVAGVPVRNIGPMSPNSHPFVAKITPDGRQLLWLTIFDGTGPGANRGRCTVDSVGAVLAQGQTGSTNFPVTSGAHQTTTHPGMSGWIAKVHPNGAFLDWATYVAGSDGGWDGADSGILVAQDGSVYFGGFSRSTAGLATPAAYQNFNHTGGEACYIGHLSSDGRTMLALTYLAAPVPTTNLTECENLTLDSAGNVYAYGITPSGNFPVTPGAFQTVFGGGNYEMFVSKLSPSLSTLLASTFIGGNGGELADTSGNILLDSSGNVWASGSSQSTNFPVTPNAFQRTLRGTRNMVFFALNSSLTHLVYSSYIGGSGLDTNRTLWIH